MARFVVASRYGVEVDDGHVRALVEANGSLTVVGDFNPRRLVVDGEDADAMRLKEAHGDFLVVEAVILHDPL